MSNSASRIEKNVLETKVKHQKTPYFEGAEKFIDAQWVNIIEPRILGGDFTNVLELAPGHGRNTSKLAPRSKAIHLVDINEHCIEACRKRFGDQAGGCKMYYYVNDGTSLAMIPDGVITYLYSWDSVVHFDKAVVERYVAEFARIMMPGAKAFVHHSNFGNLSTNPDSNWLDNPHWRSTMTRELFVEYCNAVGLVVDRQDLMPWGNIRDLDCISLFHKPA